MDEQEIIVNEYDENTIEPDSRKLSGFEIWHYIKTFLSFFAFVSAGGILLDTLYTQSPVHYLFVIMIGLGAVCALIAIKEIFYVVHHVAKWVSGIIGAISVITLIPFIPILITAVFYVGIFGLGLMLCAFFPYVMTLISYFRVTVWETFDKKKEIAVALSGFLCAVLIFVGVFVVHKSVAVAGTFTIKNELNTQQLYTEYINQHPEEEVEELNIDNPTTSTYDADSRTQTDIYEFEKNVNGAIYDCIVTIEYDYDEKWELSSIDVENNFKDYTLDVSGTFKGTGLYEGILSLRDSEYTVVIDKLTKDGGSGSFKIVNGTYSEQRNFTMTITDTINTNDDFVVKINMVFDEKLNDGLTTETECHYSLETGELTLVCFYFNDDIILKID